MKKILFALIILAIVAFILFITTTKLFAATEKKPTTLTSQLNQLIQHRMPNANIGVLVMDSKSGKILYEKDSFQAFTPASNTKLFISSAALYFLGPEFKYSTTLRIKPKQFNRGVLNGNLNITFTGDPSLKIKHLNQLIAQTKQYGIKTINGNVVIDSTRYQSPNYAPGFAVDDIVWSFAAPTTAVILNQNSVFIRITPNKRLGKLASVMPGKYTRFAKFSHHLKTVTAHHAQNHCQLLININHKNDIDITGCWPITNTSKHFNIALKNPTLFAKKMIAYQLKQNHIRLNGKIITGKTPKKSKIIARHDSKSLAVLLKPLLKNSNNIYAESLTKTLGYRYYRRGTFQDGVNAIRNVLGKKTGIDFNKMTLVDGAGSRYNLISPRQITRLLYVVEHSHKIRKTFRQALANSGIDGTLKKRMTSFDLSKNIQAKTGSMKGVSALSGYLTTHNKHKLIFSILVNHIIGTTRQARSLQNEICNLLVAQG